MDKDRRKQVSDESYRNASVAQPDSEHLAFNQTCAGSNPAGGTEPELMLLPVVSTRGDELFARFDREMQRRVMRRVMLALRIPGRLLNCPTYGTEA